jgi:integrase
VPTAKRDRVASPDEAKALLAVLPEEDQIVWATMLYAGLRLGEVQALERLDVSLKEGTINIRATWDQKEGSVEPKSRAGRRKVPIPAILRAYLVKVPLGAPDSLVFGRTAKQAFSTQAMTQRADKLWRNAKLERIVPHSCRHTYASYSIAAGVNIKALSTFMGHSSIAITLDLYGHLLPGSENEAAGLLDAYFGTPKDEEPRRVETFEASLIAARAQAERTEVAA